MDQYYIERLSGLTMKVTEMERKLNLIVQHLGLEEEVASAASVPPDLAEVQTWLEKGQKLRAVQAYQQITGVGLSEAEVAVDDLESRLKGS